MRWLATDPPTPKHRELRARKLFAWKPTRVKDHVIWLETYEVAEEFFLPLNGPGWWTEYNRATPAFERT